MRIGFVGLGKLGYPCALAIESKGHEVRGYDPSRSARLVAEGGNLPYHEAGVIPLRSKQAPNSKLRKITPLSEVVEDSEIIFVAVQTPHEPRFGGEIPVPAERVDFNYSYLFKALESISQEIARIQEKRIVVVISTVLPGTMRQILPHLSPLMKVCYNPFFIAMGTCIKDFLEPEFVLFGVHDEEAAVKAQQFYMTIHGMDGPPFFTTTVENAELIKVAYNTMIGMKIVFANTIMELCHKLPNTDVDEVVDALSLARRRLISPAYMRGGMGDGGGCHPRDNIALSWLARKLELSYDFFDSIMHGRDRQTDWLASLIETNQWNETKDNVLPIMILGKSFKPETDITTGSPALLLTHLLDNRAATVGKIEQWDPYVDNTPIPDFSSPKCIFIATKHDMFRELTFARGSTVIDPWRFLDADQMKRDGVKYIPVGVGPRK